jgi:membrane-associated protein
MLTTLVSFILSLDETLAQLLATHGAWALGLVALVIFAETGLVVVPFLPGDSLLFLAGTVIAASSLNVHVAVLALITAAALGGAVNFMIGRHAAHLLLRLLRGRWLRQSHLDATHAYFERFGASTIVIARFVPIVRTIAPFLAGAGEMSYGRFAAFNLIGATTWVALLVYAGAFLGSRPFVREHLSLIMAGIVIVSLLPMAFAGLRAARARRASLQASNPERGSD